MTFNEAEDFWRNILEAPDGYSADISREMVEAAVKAFEARKLYMADCENLREKLYHEQNRSDLISSVINYADASEAERAEATFYVDDFKVTITVERKGE